MLVNSALEPNWDRVENYYSIPFGVIPQPKPKPAFVPYAVTDDKLFVPKQAIMLLTGIENLCYNKSMLRVEND
jgi:hypothetical protein